MTATCPTNTPAKMNSPQSVVPQNFQIRGGRCGSGTAGGTSAGLAGFVAGSVIHQMAFSLSSRPAVLTATHAGAAPLRHRRRVRLRRTCWRDPGKAHDGEQLGMTRRYRIERGRRGQQRQSSTVSRATRSKSGLPKAFAIKVTASAAPDKPRVSSVRSRSTASAASASRDSARRTSRHITLPEPSQIALTGDSR